MLCSSGKSLNKTPNSFKLVHGLYIIHLLEALACKLTKHFAIACILGDKVQHAFRFHNLKKKCTRMCFRVVEIVVVPLTILKSQLNALARLNVCSSVSYLIKFYNLWMLKKFHDLNLPIDFLQICLIQLSLIDNFNGNL